MTHRRETKQMIKFANNAVKQYSATLPSSETQTNNSAEKC